jgi:hypothetical protein
MSAFPCQCCTEAFDAPQIDELVSIAGLRGGSIVPVRLSAKGMENVRRQDLYDDFTFIVGGCRYRCPPSVAQFLLPRVCRFHSIDATIDEVVICWASHEEAALMLNQRIDPRFCRFALRFRIQSRMDRSSINRITKLQLRRLLIVFNCYRK